MDDSRIRFVGLCLCAIQIVTMIRFFLWNPSGVLNEGAFVSRRRPNSSPIEDFRYTIKKDKFDAYFFSGPPLTDTICKAASLTHVGHTRDDASANITFDEIDFCGTDSDAGPHDTCAYDHRDFPPEHVNANVFWVVFERTLVLDEEDMDGSSEWYQFWIAADMHADVVLFVNDQQVLSLASADREDDDGTACPTSGENRSPQIELGPVVSDRSLPPLAMHGSHRRALTRRNLRLQQGRPYRLRLAYVRRDVLSHTFGENEDAGLRWQDVANAMRSVRLQLQWEANPHQLKVYVYDLSSAYNDDIVRSNKECETHMFGAEVWVYRQLKASTARTRNGWAADLYYVPAYTACKYLRRAFGVDPWFGKANLVSAIRLIRREYPWWRHSLGRDHVTSVTYDFGACFEYKRDKAARARVIPEAENMILLSTIADMSHPCFRPLMDVPIPVHLSSSRLLALDENPRQRDISGSISALRKSAPHRRWLGYFQGRIEWFDHDPDYSNGIRKRLYVLYANDPDIRIGKGKVTSYEENLRNSTFCICPSGFAPWSPRIYEAIFAGCIPVIVSDHVRLPFDGVFLDWRDFSVKIREENVPRLGEILRSISNEQIRRKQRALVRVRAWFAYHELAGANRGAATDGILRELGSRFSRTATSNLVVPRLPEEWL